MLQQTRVDTVIAYYERFLHRFPDIQALAAADQEDVLKHWEGLGYYRRIDHLHRAAQMISEDDGVIPSSAEELRRYPGVGDYTAAAIASIAFNQREAAVDGNIARVLSRLLGLCDSVRSTRGLTLLRDRASQLLSANRPGDFNQAWMDLGSAICTPRSPNCPACPLRPWCVAARDGLATMLPVRMTDSDRRPTEVAAVAGILVDGGKMLVRRRPIGGLWSGLWEFPTLDLEGRKSAVRRLRRLIDQTGFSLVGRVRSAGRVKHQLTHRSLTFYVYVACVEPANGLVRTLRPWRWVTNRGWKRLAVSTAHRKVFDSAQLAVTAAGVVRVG